jgi:hypothetical protein
MGVTQPRVSAIERGELDTVTLSTPRAYVQAPGGNRRVVTTADGESCLRLGSRRMPMSVRAAVTAPVIAGPRG